MKKTPLLLAGLSAAAVAGLVLLSRSTKQMSSEGETGVVETGDLVDIELPEPVPADVLAFGVPPDATFLILEIQDVTPTTVSGPFVGFKTAARSGTIPPTEPITLQRSQVAPAVA